MMMKQILVVSACWLLSVLACAGERVPLWPEGQIPNFQPQQIAARTQEGSLTLYSTKPLVAVNAENCEIVSVESAGENLWQVNLAGRQFGTKQIVQLSVQ